MEKYRKQRVGRIALIAAGLLGLSLIYFFQRADYLNIILSFAGQGEVSSLNVIFIVNKTLRLIVNDLLCLLLIYALFGEKRYLRVAFLVFCIELLFVLPLYLIVKLSMEGSSEISSPLLSQI